MNITHLRTSVGYSVDAIRNQVQGSLSAQQKKTAAIALAILTTLALCYAVIRYCFSASKDSPIQFVVPQRNDLLEIYHDAFKEFDQNPQQKEFVEYVFETGFLFDPKEYLTRWSAQSLIIGASGPEEEVRRYLAVKINFQDTHTADNKKIKDQFYALEHKINDHFKKSATRGFPFEDPDLLNEYALHVLKTGILMDPIGYLAQWEKERGMTEELRSPEDVVRHFFEKELL